MRNQKIIKLLDLEKKSISKLNNTSTILGGYGKGKSVNGTTARIKTVSKTGPRLG